MADDGVLCLYVYQVKNQLWVTSNSIFFFFLVEARLVQSVVRPFLATGDVP